MQLQPESHSDKLEKLTEWFRSLGGPVVVAFSGGVDSSVLLKAAAIALGPSNVYAVTIESPLLPAAELKVAKEVASRLGVNHIVVAGDMLKDEKVVSNPPDRCYYCKKRMIAKLKEVAAQVGAAAIVDGTNYEDLMGHRPGYRALVEEGVRTPLAELGFTKSEIREAAKALGLPNWDKPSAACLASRIPYGVGITVERLSRIERAEETVRKLTGARVVRVRDHGDVARIETERRERKLFFSEDLLDTLAKELKSLGWKYVTFDLEGYRTGSLDEAFEKEGKIARA